MIYSTLYLVVFHIAFHPSVIQHLNPPEVSPTAQAALDHPIRNTASPNTYQHPPMDVAPTSSMNASTTTSLSLRPELFASAGFTEPPRTHTEQNQC